MKNSKKRLSLSLALPLVLSFALWGCTPTEPVDEAARNAAKGAVNNTPESVKNDPNFKATQGSGMKMAGMALTPTPELDLAIQKAEAAKDKKKIAAAYADRGYVRMNDEASSPKVKYRKALADFRDALAMDPKNEKALKAKKAIEDIYAKMKIPVPTDL
jgi:tetratricopeptide (TPR) repeat protein